MSKLIAFHRVEHNDVDIVAVNDPFIEPHYAVSIPGYKTIFPKIRCAFHLIAAVGRHLLLVDCRLTSM